MTVFDIAAKYCLDTALFLQGGDLSDDLYNALYEFYVNSGEMPYGIAKARSGDPYDFISTNFETTMRKYLESFGQGR